MPTYTVISSHGNGGGVFLEPGDSVELTEQEGRWRTSIGLVKPCVAPVPAAEPPAVETPAVEQGEKEAAEQPAAEQREKEKAGKAAAKGGSSK